jgi:hypothetical protein
LALIWPSRIFSVHGFDEAGNSILAKDLKRGQVLPFFAQLERARVGLEAWN